MSIQFRLGNNDHKPVEDFLSRDPSGTGAIVLDTKNARHQAGAADAARRAGVAVLWEPAVEKLAYPGHNLDRFPMWSGELYNVDQMAISARQRGELIDRTLDAHPDFVTIATAPHFYVTDARSASLNVTLAEMTRLAADRPVRAVVTLANKFGLHGGQDLARAYFDAGIRDIEIRLSPLGGDDESLRKIRDAYATVKYFKDAGLRVTFGHSGNIGQVAVALDLADSFSVGIGMLERVNHSTTINRQKQPPKERTEEDPGGGPTAGIYLPGVAGTVTRRAGKELLDHTDVRTSLGCRLGSCGDSINGPLNDVRGHYLHARASEMNKLLATPAAWRHTIEVARLRQANELRRRVNTYYLSKNVSKLRTRTMMSLINGIDEMRQAS